MLESAASPTRAGDATEMTDDVQHAIGLLQAACSSRTVHQALECLLRQPQELRRPLIESWVREMHSNDISPGFVQAVSSLVHKDVADRAFETLFHDTRQNRPARLRPQH